MNPEEILGIDFILTPIDFLRSLSILTDKEKVLNFFNRPFTWARIISSKEELSEEDINLIINGMIIKSGTLIIDDQELYENLIKIKNYYKNKIEINTFYPWILFIAGNLKQFYSKQEDYKEDKSPFYISILQSKKNNKEEKNIFYEIIILISTDKNLVKEPLVKSIEKILELKMNELKKQKKQKIFRNPITKSIRYEVFKKNNFKCVYCGKTKEEISLEIDHILPVSQGGTDTLDNLQTLCTSCNLSKSNRILNKPCEGSC